MASTRRFIRVFFQPPRPQLALRCPMVSAWPWVLLAVFTFDRALSQRAASMIGFVSASGRLPARVLIAVVSAVAFAILVSIAATHLHTGLDSDEACAVCAAVIGKLEGPSSLPAVVPPASIPYFWQRPPAAPHVARVVRVVLPPSCGPPRFA